MKFSVLSESFTGQGMFGVLNKARALERDGRNLIHFELGDPDFETPCHIKVAATNAIIAGETHYVESSGMYDLKYAASLTTLRSRGFLPDISQLLVTSGANMQIYLALASICDPGDEVIIPVPYFPTYMSAINALGLKAVPVVLSEGDGFRMKASAVKDRLTVKTKAIIINSPSNPTGAVLSKDDLVGLFALARANDLWLLSDEVYSRQIYSGSFYSPSMIDQCKERVVVINGFSKSFAMTGWRLGVVTAPVELVQKMQMLLETIISCVPPFIQIAGVSALSKDQTEIGKMNKEFARRCIVMHDAVSAIPGLVCQKPAGGLYLWVNIENTGMSLDMFVSRLMDLGVVVCPGTVFGVANYIRLCFCTSVDNIKEGVRRMSRWMEKR